MARSGKLLNNRRTPRLPLTAASDTFVSAPPIWLGAIAWDAVTAPQVPATRKQRPDTGASGACYFFFSGFLVSGAFHAIGDAPATAGDSNFFGCLGFFASRLPRN